MKEINLKNLKIEVKKEVKEAKSLKDLNNIFQEYLGKKGKITLILRSLKNFPIKKRKEIGKEANLIKKNLQIDFQKKSEELKKEIELRELKKSKIDITQPGKKIKTGHLHPLTQVLREAEEIFQSMGFSLIEGPEIENEWYNFDALNIPKEHPARDAWDTFYLKGGFLLRTHTSPVQIRYMEKNNPPLRIVVPGRIFRHEATDASHEINFYQLEGLMVDKKISIASFEAIIQEFFRRFFEKPINIRLRPSYFPFTEPSFEIDISCPICGEKGCSTCQNSGWVEIMGAGMVHPNVLKNSGLNPKNWQGFAFGIGLDRLAMIKYKINDIRLFYNGDLRFLKQF